MISIRARRADDRIVYRVVKEYGTKFDCSPSSSEAPLTMRELIALIDTVRIEDCDFTGLVIGNLDSFVRLGGDDPDLGIMEVHGRARNKAYSTSSMLPGTLSAFLRRLAGGRSDA